ncbi:MAG TPA: hypothetical protein VFX03_01615, partial [Thermomicrobiales bacterium]|nr:hypothetical protein [Thermomicrobiales bacterium]
MNTSFGKTARTGALRSIVVLLLLVLAGLPIVGGALAQGSPTLAVVSPANGATIHTNDIPVQLKVSGLQLDCAALGRPDAAGVGQILAFIDGATIAQLANFY